MLSSADSDSSVMEFQILITLCVFPSTIDRLLYSPVTLLHSHVYFTISIFGRRSHNLVEFFTTFTETHLHMYTNF